MISTKFATKCQKLHCDGTEGINYINRRITVDGSKIEVVVALCPDHFPKRKDRRNARPQV